MYTLQLPPSATRTVFAAADRDRWIISPRVIFMSCGQEQGCVVGPAREHSSVSAKYLIFKQTSILCCCRDAWTCKHSPAMKGGSLSLLTLRMFLRDAKMLDLAVETFSDIAALLLFLEPVAEFSMFWCFFSNPYRITLLCSSSLVTGWDRKIWAWRS